MKVSEMIKNLQGFLEKNGDLDCWYATDDEGNGFETVVYEPSLMYHDSDYEVYDANGLQEIFEENPYDSIDNYTKVCVIN